MGAVYMEEGKKHWHYNFSSSSFQIVNDPDRKKSACASLTRNQEGNKFKLFVFVCGKRRTHAPHFAPEITPNRTE